MVQVNVFPKEQRSLNENHKPNTGEIEMNAQVTPWRRSSALASCKSARQAFTLVELLVVITIIGILIALMIPAVNVVMRNAKNARIGIEVANLSQAIEAYKLEMGAYPPDFALVPAEDLLAVNAHLSTVRYRNKNEIGVQVMTLDPAEAMVFWLSGISPDPNEPLNKRATMTMANGLETKPLKGGKPFFEFDQSRLNDADDDGWPEYYPEDGTAPYVYLSSQNYHVPDPQNPNAQPLAARSHVILEGTSQQQIVRAYAAELLGNGVKRFVEEEKYQIICAGLDNEFGAGSTLKPGTTAAYPDGLGYQKVDEDNITNFSEGTLQAKLP